MSCGNEFVETLKKIGYPRSDNLNGQDFDWLFESVENKPFLEWFCRNVNEQHVLTEKELQAFSTLQKSGKPVLEEQALDEVLKTCKTSDLKTSSLEGIELEELETELQTLQKLKNLKIQRLNKFRLIAAANSHRSLQLNAKEEEVTQNLKESQGFLNAVSARITNELQDLIDGVEKLTSFFGGSETKQRASPPVFLSQLVLEKYLNQEGQSTVALASYTKKHFFQGIQELVESSNEDNFQLFDLQTPSICDGDDKEAREERRLEMSRLQLAYVCAQHQLIQLKANKCSLESRIKWAEETLQTLASKAIGKENLETEISSFSNEILKLEEQITQLNNKTLPAVVKENAQLLNMPVVKGDFDLQLSRQDYYTSKQELVLNQLIKQKASFELLQLAYELELRKHRETHRQLESLAQELSQSNAAMCQRLEMLADPSISLQNHSRNTIDTKDHSTQRLYQLLEGENKKQELFRTYEGLEEVARKLKQDVSSVRDQLAIAAQEHSLFLSKLNNGVDMLCDTLYCGGNQLYLSDQELKEQFHQVNSHLKKLNHLLMDILANIKAKRRILATDKLHQMERELYVIFMKNMENFEGNVGFDFSKMPLSNVAQRIMTALHSFDLVEIKNFKENAKNEKMEHYSSIKDIPLEAKSHHYVTVMDQSQKISIISSLQSIGIKQSDQMPDIKDHNSSASLPLSSCVIPPLNFKLSSSQKKEIKKELFLKERNSIEKKDAKNLKRKHATVSHLSEQTKKCIIMEEFGNRIETKYRNSGETNTLENPVHDVRCLGPIEKSQLIEVLKQATALVVTMIYQDGTSQLQHDKDINLLVKGIIILIKSPLDNISNPFRASTPDRPMKDEFTKDDRYIYLKIEHSTLWKQEQDTDNHFVRTVLFQILKCKYTVICFNAKEFVKTVLQVYGIYGHWKQVADFVVLDPRIAAWLLDPSETISSFEDLVRKYFEESVTMKRSHTIGSSTHSMVNLCSDLRILYRLTVDLCSELKVCGLWQLFYTLEIPLIPILAVMETHKIQVNKEEMKRISKLLGFRLKELEQEAHIAAGEKFLVTSNNQLREVLFDKLKLHLLCKSKNLPKTELQKYPSTSETALNALQDFHPLPKIILEYRQIHKVKSTFVDGLLSCMRKGFIASTWNQTGTVSGRLSAKKPAMLKVIYHVHIIPQISSLLKSSVIHLTGINKNIQGISKHPIQITKHHHEQGKEDEKTTISPRTMFISSKGRTFLAADFSQIELRILAHLSGDPELLKLFQEVEGLDVFISLTSQWKGIPLEQVTHVEREQTKRVVYSVVYGAGKERLAACLGVTALQASQFIESFLQKYKKIQDFTQETIMQCHNKGYVTSIMGRRRLLPNINAQDYRLRTQAERQAVNFVVQGSAADLCKMAMIKIFASVATDSKLTARLLAQIHDELLFEVEDSQIPEFAVLVKETMESLQNIQAMGLHLKVPLRVSLAAGRSWGSLYPLPGAVPGLGHRGNSGPRGAPAAPAALPLHFPASFRP